MDQEPIKVPSSNPEQTVLATPPQMNVYQNNPNPSNKSSKLPLVIIAVVLLIAAAAGAVFLTKNKPQQNMQGTKNSSSISQKAAEPQAVKQEYISPIDGTKTDIKTTSYYTITQGSDEYYGQVSKINDNYIRLLPTAYKKVGALIITGNELHGPEAVTYFRVSNITKFQELTDVEILNAIKTITISASDAYPGSDINKYVKSGQMQAYFFADGSVFYAKTTSLDATFLAHSSHVYAIRTNSSNNTNDISLMIAKPEQYNNRTADTLLYWQNMKTDSQITKAVIEYEKQNP